MKKLNVPRKTDNQNTILINQNLKVVLVHFAARGISVKQGQNQLIYMSKTNLILLLFCKYVILFIKLFQRVETM